MKKINIVIIVLLVILVIVSIMFNVKQYNDLKYIEIEAKKVSSELESLKGTLQEKESVITDKDNQIVELEKTIADLQKQIEDLESQVTTLLAEKEDLTKQLEEIKKMGSTAETSPQQGGGSANVSEEPSSELDAATESLILEKFGMTNSTGNNSSNTDSSFVPGSIHWE